MSFSDHARAFGFGRDRAGDRRRREEQGVAELSDGTTVAGVDPEWVTLGHLTPKADAALRESISRAIGSAPRPGPGNQGRFTRALLSEAVQRDLLRRARKIEDDALRMTTRAADPPVSDDDPEVPGHRLLREQHGQATVVRCECGRWDGGWLGPRSRRRVLDDHAAHVATELSAAGPLIVPSERADRPKEIE